MSEQRPAYEVKKTIIRVEKNKDNPFVMMDRRALEKPYMSWKAKGLLAYLLSRPDNWTVNFGDLIKRSTDGEHATRAAAKELQEAGHLEVKRRIDDKGRVTQYEYIVHEYPLCGFPQVDNPNVENLDINDTESNDINDDKEDDPQKPNIFRYYENNIAMLTQKSSEVLKDAEQTYPTDWIFEAIDLAVLHNARNWKYCEAILRRWKEKGKDTGKPNGKGKPHADNTRPVTKITPELLAAAEKVKQRKRERAGVR